MSVDELAAYLAYALRILKNCDLPCEGITTPGGFGSQVKTELSAGRGPGGSRRVRRRVAALLQVRLRGQGEHAAQAGTSWQGWTPTTRTLVVSVPAGTGDWFGGWDGDSKPDGHRYANHDATSGRMVELIERGEPAVMLCHWPGLYYARRRRRGSSTSSG